ncbi:MAG: DUF4446 family protein [Candidatus Eremiobacteraeota bacterium]|nr:DUF4446 family protein [Candidatus Eremiobacteraeota bacterium]
MQITIVAACAAFVGALIALAIYHACVVGPALRRARSDHDALLAGGTTPALERRVERSEQSLSELEARARTDVSRVGFVRYSAFDDTGSQLSYAVALLSREGDGVVLSSIYSRTDTRTFGKAVEKFTPLVQASQEELDAIAKTRSEL